MKTLVSLALGAVMLYSKLTNVFRRSSLFYGIILAFMGFIALYAFVLYPNLDALSPHRTADALPTRSAVASRT